MPTSSRCRPGPSMRPRPSGPRSTRSVHRPLDLGIRLQIDAPGTLEATGDPERVAQIVANLVENALKYARERIDVSVAAPDDHTIELVVADDGPGIDPAERHRVFERLFVSRAVPGRSVGTGLGLAIVGELANAMGGSATVEPRHRSRAQCSESGCRAPVPGGSDCSVRTRRSWARASSSRMRVAHLAADVLRTGRAEVRTVGPELDAADLGRARAAGTHDRAQIEDRDSPVAGGSRSPVEGVELADPRRPRRSPGNTAGVPGTGAGTVRMTSRAPRRVSKAAALRTSRPNTRSPAWVPIFTRRPPRSRSTASQVESQTTRSGRGELSTTLRKRRLHRRRAPDATTDTGRPSCWTVTPRSTEHPGWAAVANGMPRAAIAASSPGPSDAASESPTSTAWVGLPGIGGTEGGARRDRGRTAGEVVRRGGGAGGADEQRDHARGDTRPEPRSTWRARRAPAGSAARPAGTKRSTRRA